MKYILIFLCITLIFAFNKEIITFFKTKWKYLLVSGVGFFFYFITTSFYEKLFRRNINIGDNKNMNDKVIKTKKNIEKQLENVSSEIKELNNRKTKKSSTRIKQATTDMANL